MEDIKLSKEEATFITQVFSTVKVNEVPVQLQSLVQIMNKLNPLPKTEKDD